MTQILAIEPPPVSASVTATRAWRTHVRSHTAALIEVIRGRDDEDRDQIAARLAVLPAGPALGPRARSVRAGNRSPRPVT